ncbi:hypothetical protein HS041_37875 [Planomonospora sp. ID67723]|uniref:DUF6113 family protein n=1 Tax=Planomonospora sp. ID67723 TaxID=2738134 RepID=UPI0018C3AB6B|nr:DUF6113 family protein [Planomonospora sp. ID67723]MBG0833474.1 hypothetical protein [Planomonospora sp. ID67723]
MTEQVPGVERPSAALTAVTYAVLAVPGLVSGVLGGFHHSWYLRPVPVSAIGWIALLFGLCYGAGRMLRGKPAALAPAVGWILVTMLWLSQRPEGDLIVADDLSGYVYLYGGMLAVMAGVLLAPSKGGGSWLLAQHSYGRAPVRPDPS